MDIAAELAAFDGRHTDVLEELAGRLSPTPEVIDALCALAGNEDPDLQSAATWILKRLQDDGATLAQAQIDALLDVLGRAASWDAKLHLLQMLSRWEVPDSAAGALFRTIQGDAYLFASNTFVRAWSYNGLAALAESHPDLREEAAALLAAGERDDAASVRARIRNIAKQMDWVRLAAP